MGSTVRLDKSSWNPLQLERVAAYDAMVASAKRRRAFERLPSTIDAREALAAAKREHPLHGALDTVTEDSFEATRQGDLRVKVTDFQNGHVEACVWRHRPDPYRTLDRAMERDLRALVPKMPRGEGDREASLAAALRRASQRVRYLCKAMIVNSLWTLTFRENVTDRDLCLKHLKEFIRRVKRVLPDLRYIAVLERQERGAWHVHIATHELPGKLRSAGVSFKSWDLMRSIWRSVVGALGGTFNEAKRAKRWGKGSKRIKGSGAIARYISGYVAKDMRDTELNRKRYSHSEGIEVPASYKASFPPETPLNELIELAYAALGRRITRRWFDPVSGVFFAESDDTEALRSG